MRYMVMPLCIWPNLWLSGLITRLITYCQFVIENKTLIGNLRNCLLRINPECLSQVIIYRLDL